LNELNIPTISKSKEIFEALIANSKTLNLENRPSIVVDFGSYECRAGLSSNPDGSCPSAPFLNFKNVVAKPKTLINKDIDSIHIVGDEFALFE